MTRILFVCSGNTCRSPMAEGVARQIFGQGHVVQSAGAETTTGSKPARKAVLAMKEIGLELAGVTTDVSEVDLSTFDTLVIFRPSAMKTPVPSPTQKIEYFDIDDPYGCDLDTYRLTLRSIQRSVRKLHAEDVLNRLRSTNAKATGSHIAGMFSRAAKEFEKEIKQSFQAITGKPPRPKATLGQLGDEIKAVKASATHVEQLSTHIGAVNDAWVRVKHGDDPPPSQLDEAIAHIVAAYQIFR